MKSFDGILPHAVLEVRETLFSCASETYAATALRFFKTGAGAYGEGDRFIGVRVPEVRKIARDFAPKLSPEEVLPLLRDTVHECRLLALLVWVQQFSKGDERIREKIVSLYLSHTTYINNWDLVDLSAVGWMLREIGKRDKAVLVDFLETRYNRMPRTMLRYAIEKFTPEERARYMKRSWREHVC